MVGGIENHLKVLAEGLVARGHEATVLVTNTDRATTRGQQNGVRVLKAGRMFELASTPLSLDLVRTARAVKPDLVHLHMPYPPGDLAARAVAGAPPLVVTYHSDIVRQRRLLQLYRPLLHATLRRANKIIVTSTPYIQSSPFLRKHVGKCRVVPLSVDPARFAGVSPAAVTALRQRLITYGANAACASSSGLILTVGVLRYYKGLDVLLDALTQLDAQLVIVGSGPEEARLRALAQAFGVANRVLFAGRVGDAALPLYYAAADVFVSASQVRAEAFGIVLLEAMAAGLPVVSTELGTGTSVVNQHGRTGFVVPPSDPHALAQALKVLLANEDLRRQLGSAARQRVQAEYTDDLMLARTVAVYEEALLAGAQPLAQRSSAWLHRWRVSAPWIARLGRQEHAKD